MKQIAGVVWVMQQSAMSVIPRHKAGGGPREERIKDSTMGGAHQSASPHRPTQGPTQGANQPNGQPATQPTKQRARPTDTGSS